VELTAWQAATPFLVNLGLLALLAAISVWIRTHVEKQYTDIERERNVRAPSFARPDAQANLAIWAVDLSGLFSTLAVTTASSAVMLQGDLDPSLFVYGAMLITIVGFAVAIRFVSPIKYPKHVFFKVSYLVWAGALLNAIFVGYSLIHYF
jgi:hypothetical protein